MTDTRVPPEWLTQEYVEHKLRIGLKSPNLRIVQYSIKPAVAVGENSGSLMFRITLKIEKQDKATPERLSLIAKTMADLPLAQELSVDLDVFRLESGMYVDTLPSMQRMLDEVVPGKYQKLFADAYYTEGAPNYIILLEDLCESGFKTPKRSLGLDLDHCVYVLENLGRFHASSYVLTRKKPSVIEEYRKYFYCESTATIITKFVKGGIASVIEEASTWTDFPVKYVEKLKQLQPVILEKIFEAYKRNDDYKYNVILHGDLWMANMLFKHEEDKITGWKMIDFQTVNYNSPALDLNHFIFANPTQEVRDQHLDSLLQIYYNSFMETLTILNYSADYSFEECKMEFYNRLMFGLYCCILIMPLQCAERSEEVDFDDLFELESSEFKNKHVFKTESYKNVLKKMMPFFVDHGAL